MTIIHRFVGIAATVLALAVLIGWAGTGIAEDSVRIAGAGATFPAPLYKKWIEEFQKERPQISIRYDVVGSGEGIQRFIKGSVDFGASDAAMSDGQIAQVQRGVQLIPATAGMVVLAYNLGALNGELKLKRDVYVDIFAGNIRDWDDPRIKASNPDIALPHETIAIVARLDSSGTTYALTNHLSAISETWRDQGPGAGKVIDWPGNTMLARGNEGVASKIKISEGSIGYVEYGFAKRLGLPMVWLENKAGQFVKPDEKTGQQALVDSSEQMPDNLRLYLPDPQGAGSYPIVTYSWLLLYEHYPEQKKASALKDFVTWGLGKGQEYSTELGYLPLPPQVASIAQAAVNKIQ